MLERRPLRTLCICLAFAAASAGAAAQPDWAGRPGGPDSPNYHGLRVFGDSLSDTGNDAILTAAQSFDPTIPPSANYFEGRFSNGPVAVEHLWRLLDSRGGGVQPSLGDAGPADAKSAVSYAFGGSGSGHIAPGPGGFQVPGVLTQIDVFRSNLQGKKANNQALYMIWTGSNDYLFYGATDPGAVVANIVAAIEALHDLGARHFLVPNLPDLGATPMARAQGTGPARTQLALAHNERLAKALDDLRARRPGLHIVAMDVAAFVQRQLAEGHILDGPPAAELVAPGSGAADCLFRAPKSCPNVPLDEAPPVIYWDILHPSARAHELLGRGLFEALISR